MRLAIAVVAALDPADLVTCMAMLDAQARRFVVCMHRPNQHTEIHSSESKPRTP